MNRKLVSAAVAGALGASTTAHAVKYKLSGQVNRAVVYMDDGAQTDLRNVDNDESGTRWRLRGSETLGGGLSVGFYYEMQTSSSPSESAYPDQNSDGANGVSDNGNIRQANVWFSSQWGKLSLGQLDGAGDGTTEVDLSGTDDTGAYSTRTSFTGGMRWRTSGGSCITSAGLADPGCATPATVDTFYSAFDAFSRYDGIRYDSPALGPVVVSASIGNDTKWEVAARANSALAGGELSAGLFYGQASGALDSKARYGGSVSYLFHQGTSITGSYARNEPQESGPNASVWSVKLGQKWGHNAVSIGYGEASDVVRDFTDRGWNVGFNHSLPKADTDLYASFFFQKLDSPAGTASVEDLTLFAVGARVQFQ